MKHRRTPRATVDECKTAALKNLDILDLIKAAQKNQDCSRVAAQVFEQNYGTKLFRIEKYPQMQHDTNSVVLISNLQAATTMINHFGHLIQKLSIQINVDAVLCELPQIDEVINLLMAVDAHCRDSLSVFELNYVGCNVNNVFKQIRGPFGRVETLLLNLYNMNEQTEGQPLRLNTIFPNVRQLTIVDLDHLKDSKPFDCRLPKLEKLVFREGIFQKSLDTQESNELIFKHLLKKNPHIQTLSLIYPTSTALGYIKKYPKNLQELDIVMVNQEAANDEYLNLLLKFPKIRKITASNSVNKAGLSKLVGKFPSLTNALFGFDKDVRVNDVIDFVKKSPSLNYLEFVHANVEDVNTFENQLKKELGADFNIKYNNVESTPVKVFFIIRKIPIVLAPEPANSAAGICRSAIHNTAAMFVAAFVARYFFL